MSLRARACALAWLLLLAACGDEPTPVTLARFDRPNRVDFVCVLAGEPVQLEHCQSDILGNDMALHALVTQAARGEIAALDLDAQRVLDSRRDIPGFTFLPVGEAPVAVVVPPRHPEVTYVANYGSRDIRALTTAALVTPQSADPTLRILRLALDADDRVHVLASPAELEDPAALDGLRVIAPTDMVLAPSENGLIVAAPDAGKVIWVPIDRCRDGAPDCVPGLFDETSIAAVPLQRSVELALGSQPEAAPPSEYAQLCEFRGGEPPQPAPPPDIPDETWMTPPRPTALAIDRDCPEQQRCAPRVLVADESLPIIHALDVDALAAGGAGEDAVLPPLVSGAPTVAVAVSPVVPATVDAGGETKYVYAIDAADGSVMVLEDGRLLNVNTGATGRPDRIAFQTSAGATALAIVTPGFDPAEGADQWVGADQCTDAIHTTRGDPLRLRGVFLASAHTDGIVRFVDIHDMELKLPGEPGECDPAEPGPECPCRICPLTDPPMPVLRRHQQRIARSFVVGDAEAAPRTTPSSEPRFVARGLSFSVRSDGTTGNPELPGLDCIACEPTLDRAYPPPDTITAGDLDGADAGAEGEGVTGCSADAPALVCGSADPWSGGSEQWIVTFEGPIPDTVGQGRLIPQGSEESRTGAFELAADIDFCAAGVLGEEDRSPWFVDQVCDPETERFLRGRCACSEADGNPCASLDTTLPECVSGDQLVLRPVLPAPDSLDADDSVVQRCRELRDALQEEDARPIGFEIRRAYRDRLVLRTSLADPAGRLPVRSIDELLPCLERGLVAFDVRTLDQYTVQGALSGFQHSVQADAAGRCVVAAGADPLRQGRALPGCTFRNQAIELRLHDHRPDEDERPPRPGTALVLSVGTPGVKLVVDIAETGLGTASSVAQQMRYEPISESLFVVDIHGRGLIPISLDPVPRFVSGSFN